MLDVICNKEGLLNVLIQDAARLIGRCSFAPKAFTEGQKTYRTAYSPPGNGSDHRGFKMLRFVLSVSFNVGKARWYHVCLIT